MRQCLEVGVICMLLLSCSAPEPPLDETEEHIDAGRIRFFFPAGEAPCAGTPRFLDDMLSHLADFLKITPPNRLEYHYRPAADLSDVCGHALSYAGCSFPGEARVWSRDATSVHELVHALTSQDGEHYSFLSEGLATALGEENVWPLDYDVPESTYLASGTLSPAENGGIAGDLTSHLLLEFGAERFMDLYRRVPPRATIDRFKADFEAVYNVDFDAVLGERRVSNFRFGQNRLRFPECALPGVDWDGERWVSTTDVECEASAIGPSTRLSALPGAAWRGQTLEVAAEGPFEIAFSASSGGARLYRCDMPQESWSFTARRQPLLGQALGQRTVTYGRLAAGKYALLAHSDERDQPASVTVSVSPSTPMPADCVQEPPLKVADEVDGLYLIAEPESVVVRRFELLADRSASGAFSEAKLCDERCGACSSVPEFEALPLDAGVTYSVEVSGDPYRQADGVQLAPN